MIFADVDELLVYPGWPDISLSSLVSYLTDRNAEALFCTMVDMYSPMPIAQSPYEPGKSMLAHCPLFDTDGYWRLAKPLKEITKYPTPPFHIFGGARNRLLRTSKNLRLRQRLAQYILGRVFSIHSDALPKGGWLRLYHAFFRQLKGFIPESPEVMSKVPLLKWDTSCEFREGVHSLRNFKPVSSDWGALLHFKYLSDLKSKIAENVSREQHAKGSFYYKEYDKRADLILETSLVYDRTGDARDPESLIVSGLMRRSAPLADFINQQKQFNKR